MHIAFQKQHVHPFGGLEKYTQRLANAFCKNGIRTTMLCSECSTELPCEVIEFGKLKNSLNFRRLQLFNKQCSNWIKDNQPQGVFGIDRPSERQTHYRAGNGVHAAYLEHREDSYLKKLTFKWNPLHRTILDLEKRAFNKLKVIFANSHMVKEELIKFYKIPEKNIHVVHNGVEWNDFENDYLKWKSKDTFQFLFIGHEYQRKGLDRLLHALPFVKGDFHLNVVGRDRREHLYQQLVKKLGLVRNVTFHGQQHETRSFYQQADCVVIPSVYDPFANVTVEALAMGNFVISSNLNGGKEVITSDSGKIVDQCQNPIALAKALQDAMKSPKTPSSATAIRQSVKHLDFDTMLQKIVDTTLETL